MDTEDRLKILDPIACIRAHPEMYLPWGLSDGDSLALRLADDAMATTGLAISLRAGEWWGVASEADWIGLSKARGVSDYFERIIPFPEAGPNSMRAGILVAAFAEDVVTWDETAETLVKGRAEALGPMLELRRRHPEWKRLVAFRPSPADASAGSRAAKTTRVKTGEEIQAFVETMIARIYKHPKLFGADAESVMLALRCYHDVWAKVANRGPDYNFALRAVLKEEGCGPYYFSTHYKKRLARTADDSEDSAIDYVIRQWRKVDARLGLEDPSPR